MKNVIVTGASRGIGKAIAEAFAAGGCSVFINARNEEALKETTEEINSKGQGKVHYKAADMADKASVEAFADWCLSFGNPDILVNNAGVFIQGNCVDEHDGALENILKINLMSAWNLTRKIAPVMKQAKSGHIFNISSIAGTKAYPGGGVYSISKYAMNGFNDNLRHELMPFGVKVTNVLPGATLTDSWGGFDNSNGRIMEAEDIAKMVVAASQLSSQAVVETILVRPQLGDL